MATYSTISLYCLVAVILISCTPSSALKGYGEYCRQNNANPMDPDNCDWRKFLQCSGSVCGCMISMSWDERADRCALGLGHVCNNQFGGPDWPSFGKGSQGGSWGGSGGNQGGNQGGSWSGSGGNQGGNQGGSWGSSGGNQGGNQGGSWGSSGGNQGGNQGGSWSGSGGNQGGNQGGSWSGSGGNQGGNQGSSWGSSGGNQGGNWGSSGNNQGGNQERCPKYAHCDAKSGKCECDYNHQISEDGRY